MSDFTFADDVLVPLAAGERLTEQCSTRAVRAVVDGSVPAEHVAAFAVAMAARGETVDELSGMARAVLAAAVPVEVDDPASTVDTCGTGGDGRGTFNISTAAAVVAAAAGAVVAKHGNRAASSTCGSTDVLGALGVGLAAGPGDVVASLRAHRLAFLPAPVFHPALGVLAPLRRSLRARTAFNLLGPLCHPARVGRRVLGVPRASLVAPVAEVLHRLGVRRALVLCAADGTDELVPGVPAHVVHVDGDRLRPGRIDPEELGLDAPRAGALDGGDPAVNAAILRSVMRGETGPRRDAVLLNAAAALLVADRCADLGEGLVLAGAAVDSGAADGLLDAMTRTGRPAEAVPA